MNLRVDLILPDERRSGNPITLKTLVRVSSIVGPLVLVIVVGKLLWSSHQANTDFMSLKQELELARPQHAQAVELMETFTRNREIKDELSGWANSRLDWSEQLLGLMQIVPPNVQLQSFRTKESLTLINDRIPCREYSFSIKGRAVTEDAEDSVRELIAELKTASPFGSTVISNVVMDGRADTSPSAAPTDRTFDITCTYLTRNFQ